MKSEFPYQLVAFLDREPSLGESVYGGEKGWYPQIALKRRFRSEGLSESGLEAKIGQFCMNESAITLRTGDLAKTDRMPVKIIEIVNKDELMAFHLKFIDVLGKGIVSKFPEREHGNYLPHVTAEYDGKMVIDTESYVHNSFTLQRVCLLRDMQDGESAAHAYFTLG